MGGVGSDRGNSIVIDIFDNIYTTGNFENTANCHTEADTFNLTSFGLHDIFIHKLGTTVTSITKVNSHNLQVYPNPTSGVIIFETSNKHEEIVVEVYDQLGNEIITKTYNNVFKGEFVIDTAPGIYFMTIKTNTNEMSVHKVVKL